MCSLCRVGGTPCRRFAVASLQPVSLPRRFAISCVAAPGGSSHQTAMCLPLPARRARSEAPEHMAIRAVRTLPSCPQILRQSLPPRAPPAQAQGCSQGTPCRFLAVPACLLRLQQRQHCWRCTCMLFRESPALALRVHRVVALRSRGAAAAVRCPGRILPGRHLAWWGGRVSGDPASRRQAAAYRLHHRTPAPVSAWAGVNHACSGGAASDTAIDMLRRSPVQRSGITQLRRNTWPHCCGCCRTGVHAFCPSASVHCSEAVAWSASSLEHEGQHGEG